MSYKDVFSKFSIRSQKILIGNNITANIKMPIQEIESRLVCEGYEILDVTKDFFELCAYFNIVYVWNEEDDSCCELIVDPTDYADSDDRIYLDNLYGKKLCPIAYLGWGALVMIDWEENMYLLEDGNFNFLGDSLIAGIEEIFKGKNWRLQPS
jgi:SUKH-3 immunity protein